MENYPDASKKVWQKLEDKSGYPYYVNTENGLRCPDHPELGELLRTLEQYAGIKYCAYRTAFKIYEIQKKIQVWSARVSMGVLARHCLSISESSLTLEPCELEAVLADVHFACVREHGADVDGDTSDSVPDLLLNIILNMYHPERTNPVRVQAVKVLLTLLSDSPCEEKWLTLVETCADHNGCVSARRLAALLELVSRTVQFLGETTLGPHNVQKDVDDCFAKSAGMLGMPARAVVAWALQAAGGSVHTRWLLALDRVRLSRLQATAAAAVCSSCAGTLSRVLRFRCVKCSGMVVCERCYLHDSDLTQFPGHKKTHAMREILQEETLPHKCLDGFMKDFKRLFACTRYRSRKKRPKLCNPSPITEVDSCQSDRVKDSQTNSCQVESCQASGKGIITSTVGRAAGNFGGSAQVLLQDIISQLESQNRALKELSCKLQGAGGAAGAGAGAEGSVRQQVDSRWEHIAAQINRLKLFKENLSACLENPKLNGHTERMQAFDLFSPIPTVMQYNGTKSDKLSQPRILSLDSGNFSDATKPSPDSQLMTVSGDAIKPVVVHATSDSISTVSMNDISMWYGVNGTDVESINERRLYSGNFNRNESKNKSRSDSLSVTEQRYDADLQSVANSNFKMKELNADLDTVLDRLQQILSNTFVLDDASFDNTHLRATASEMEDLLGTLIRGVEERTTHRRPRDASSAL